MQEKGRYFSISLFPESGQSVIQKDRLFQSNQSLNDSFVYVGLRNLYHHHNVIYYLPNIASLFPRYGSVEL